MRFAEPVISATLPCMFMTKVAIITGASRGIGLAIARRLHQEGANVALCARSSIEDLGKERSMAVAMDIRDSRNVEAGVGRILERERTHCVLKILPSRVIAIEGEPCGETGAMCQQRSQRAGVEGA